MTPPEGTETNDIYSTEEDADSCGCAIVDLSSQSSMESCTNGAEDDAIAGRENDIALEFLSLQVASTVDSDSDAVKIFYEMIQHSPSLYNPTVDFRCNNFECDHRRMENPSAAAAMNHAEEIRKQFDDKVIKVSGTLEEQKFWSSMSSEECDEFLCRIFLPPSLGGLLFPDVDRKR